MTVDLSSPEVREALARAAEFRLLGLLFERPRPGLREERAELARETGDAGLQEVAAALRELDEPAYVALLGPGGPVSPREVAYRPREDPAWVMADIAAFYRAFGFAPKAEDPADHVAVEVGFAGYLWLKEAYARHLSLPGEMEVTSSARSQFLKDHLSTLAAGIAARLGGIEGAEGLAALARLLASRVGPPAVAPSPATGDAADAELTCGARPDTELS